MKRRLGSFTLTIGITLIILFFISDLTQSTNFSFLLWGVLITALGWLLMRGTKASSAPTESGRFRTVRKIFGRKKKKDGGGNG